MKPNHHNRLALFPAAVGLVAVLSLSGPIGAHGAEIHHAVLAADELNFRPGPPTLPAGVEFAVLHGNPAEPGPFVLQLKFPAGYIIPPHMHPEDEHVTVISGSFGMGAGDVHDTSKAPLLAPGSFVRIPTGMAHFAWTEAETVVQINVMGPFGITYVNPHDDPRSRTN
ncbi:cupin domain-containing protein [Limibaculum sp. FT325]|uniref:cupin domain-containing protein n=1 Tax=Thermohalobaculum sediminis TaxID=2939436 RepID=UPI0020C133B1|nr:cupin domain-containing protein [Limibaculum sediminis]MCL5779037.1 cupin domain-containing protein [Limibaculum sediminis]